MTINLNKLVDRASEFMKVLDHKNVEYIFDASIDCDVDLEDKKHTTNVKLNILNF